MARDQFLESCNREQYVHLKSNTFKNLDEMAREAELFAEARGGVSSYVAKGQRDNKDNKGFSKVEPSRSGNKPEIKCRICGEPHLTYKCWNKTDRNLASSVDVDTGEGRLVSASSADTTNPQFKGDDSFNRGRGNHRGRSYGRGNNRGQGRGFGNKFDNATRGGHQFKFCKVKGQKGSSDGVESIYQSKVDDSLHSDVNDKEEVCYFLKSRLRIALGTVDDQKGVVLGDTGCTGVV